MNQDRLEKLRKIYAEYPRRQLAEQLLLDFKEYVKSKFLAISQN